MEVMDSEYEESRDIISNLPDALLCHILSFLPTKSAVGTSILSKRWRYLWASVPILDFDDELWVKARTSVELEERLIMFTNFVDRVLHHSEVLCIKKFRLGYHDNNLDIVYSWICIALERRVQELDLHLLIDWAVELPPMFFICKTLVVVKLWCAVFLDIPTTVWLPSLKTLHLRSVEYSDDDSIQKLLSGCPVLEELVIEREERDNQWVVNVSNPSLKSLRIFFFTDGFPHPYELEDQEYKVVVDAPNLEYLSISDYLSKDYFVKDLPSLVKAFIDIEQDSEEFEENPYNGNISYHGPIYELLGRISNVKCLSLTGITLDSLSGTIGDYKLPTFHNMTRLEFLNIGGFNWDFLPYFLHSSPNLEALIIDTGYTNELIPEGWLMPPQVPACLVLHLKEIGVRRIVGEDYELQAVEYLLKNAKILQQMTVDCHESSMDQEFCVCKKLLGLPKGSRSCQLTVLCSCGETPFC